MFEYKTTFFPLQYQGEPTYEMQKGRYGMLKVPVYPNPGPNPELEAQMIDMGKEGWELVSVQPFSRPQSEHQRNTISGFLKESVIDTSYIHLVHMGYFFFWKRKAENQPLANDQFD